MFNVYNLYIIALIFQVVSSITFDEWFINHNNHVIYHDKPVEQIVQNWLNNHQLIETHNSQNLSYQLGHNLFSGLNSSEFAELMNFKENSQILLTKSNTKYNFDIITDLSQPPSSVDWTMNGAVTPVKDQGQCGSCWSFSTTGALEGAYEIKYGKLVSFSEQQLVDCDNLKNGGNNHGCNGGLMDSAFKWISSNGGLCSESAYPYVSGVTKTANTCQTTCTKISGSTIVKYVDVTPGSDNTMMYALSQQPVSVAIEADQSSFQLYRSGVFTGDCGTNLDHGVLLVGYGTDNGVDFYKIKNSWGTGWGENGYIRIGRGTQYNNGQGQCGVLLEGSYPVL
jgi:C1A family cysteine protease